MKKKSKMTRSTFIRNIITTAALLSGATVISYLFLQFGGKTVNVAIIYILAVTFIARYTDGYVPGIFASVIGVFCVNYAFTFPFMVLDFTLDGYPITFAAMLLISGLTSTTTTHLKEQHRILNEREKLLRDAEKETMRANLLRAISHDLRTPLTGIIGSSSAFMDSYSSLSDKERLFMVNCINEDANWLLNMVENLLSVTRIRDDGTQVTKNPEPLEEVAAEAVQRFRKRLPDALVQVTVPDQFFMVPMDATLIEQVIINLLENAVYHSDSSEPLKLTAEIHDGFAWFHVIDNGKGIASDRTENLFDSYTSSPNSSGDSHKGMGIGLSICKTIITAHGGEIFVVNEERGARFTFSLPLGGDTNEQD